MNIIYTLILFIIFLIIKFKNWVKGAYYFLPLKMKNNINNYNFNTSFNLSYNFDNSKLLISKK